MILARLSQAIRAQNWFAVALEFVIVIAGVVIGFQVTELAATARDSAEEERALGRLRLESEAVVNFWTEDVETAVVRDRERIALLRALESGIVADGEESAVYNGIERLYFYAALNPPRTVFDELLASGGLSRISDPAARAAVSEYADTLSFITGQLLQFRTSVPDGMAAMDGHVFSRYDPSSATLRLFEYDIAALSGDRAFTSEIVNAARDQRVFLFFRMGALGRALDMCEALSRAEGASCATLQTGRRTLEAARNHLNEMREAPE